MTAIKYQHFELVVFLLLNGASIDIENNNSRNSIYYAQKGKNVNITNVINNWQILMLMYCIEKRSLYIDTESISMLF